ncbi:26S protease regulatory subunit 6A [Histomonas meleagridis]|uniref:26S protease regulatory subunit 6A n=1 Tax=Histomonas meleagridis TaxID=135588 RepID=UPI00355AA8F7|nr:26S protease regulatory subunit 6A [Histomonas meleagridis]
MDDFTNWIIDDQIKKMEQKSAKEIEQQNMILENKINAYRNMVRQYQNQKTHMEEDIRSNNEKIRLNRTLPFLVAHVVEVLSLDSDESSDSVYRGLDSKSAVVKTTTRETVFLPVPGLVDASDLQPSDMVGLSKDSYLIFEKLPQHFDSRVKAMEVDSKPTETYDQVGGLEKQIQELKEAVVLPLISPSKERIKKLGIQPPKGRPDTLDPALMRSGRLDRKIELPLPNEDARVQILEIH